MADSRKRRDSRPLDGPTYAKKKFDFTNVTGYRFLIPSKAGGCMIGKGGEIIKRLRTQFSCRIIVPDSKGPERMLILDGEIDVIMDFWNEVMPSIAESLSAKESDFKNSGNKQLDDENVLDLRMVVHESQVGTLIGKGGERIRNLIDTYKMSMIKIYHGLCPHSTDRVVRLVGQQENLLDSLRSMLTLLENQPVKGTRCDYDPDNYDESAAPSYGGYINKDPRFANRAASVKMAGDKYGDYMPRTNSFDSHSHHSQYNDNAVHPMYFAGNKSRAPIPSGVSDLLEGIIRLTSVDDGQKFVCRVVVPINLVNAIIGTDGHRLSDIKRDSGALVQLDEDRFSEREELFVIRGTADQIYKAQCLMQLCARKYGDSGMYGY